MFCGFLLIHMKVVAISSLITSFYDDGNVFKVVLNGCTEILSKTVALIEKGETPGASFMKQRIGLILKVYVSTKDENVFLRWIVH